MHHSWRAPHPSKLAKYGKTMQKILPSVEYYNRIWKAKTDAVDDKTTISATDRHVAKTKYAIVQDIVSI